MPASLEIVHGSVLTEACDTLILKYARTFHGADRAVADALGLAGKDTGPAQGEHEWMPTRGQLACAHVLFYGVGRLSDFRYREIRAFAVQSLKTLATLGAAHGTVAMTMHGVGYGLDEREAFSAQVAGILEYLAAAPSDASPRRIIVVERDFARFERMEAVLKTILLAANPAPAQARPAGQPPARLPDAGIRSEEKRHVFVAMPFTDEMEDVYELGIKDSVNGAGFLCERCDQDIFTGDILNRIKGRITTASMVVADLSGSNANVYLEVGYAWGKGVTTLLIAREGETLKFDVAAQKCLFYKNISQLRKQLTECMVKLRAES